MKFVIAPDSFKGSLSAVEVCRTMERAVRDEWPEAETVSVPMADGGEGTVEALVLASGGTFVDTEAAGPFGEPVQTRFGVVGSGDAAAAVIEAANICGLTMVDAGRRNPLNTTSRGLADVLKTALDRGYRRIVIGLGGSCTNDGGIGLLAGLGVKFTDRAGEPLYGFGRDLAAIAGVDMSSLEPRLRECSICIASDVTNPLLGPQGATHIYGPQKGADPERIVWLESAMNTYADLFEAKLGRRLREQPGAGAAGGLGFALMALGADMEPGARVVERMTGLRGLIQQADWVFTGEGRSDSQTLYGKLPYYVATIAEECGKNTTLISGSLDAELESLSPAFAGCFSIANGPISLQDCLEQADSLLYQCARQIVRMLRKSIKFA